MILEQLKKQFVQRSSLGLIALGVMGAVITVQLTGALQLLEWVILDHWFRLRPLEARKSPVVLVTIDETDISRLGHWPISDAKLAIVLETLKRSRPAVIGLDLYRNLPVEPGHSALLSVFASTPNLIGIEKVVGDAQGPTVPPPPVLRDRNQVAVNDLVIDADGTVRRNLLSVRRDGTLRLSLGTQLALKYLETVQITTRREGRDETSIYLGKARFQPMHSHTGGYVRADVGGYQTLSNFLRLKDDIPRISLTDVLNNRVPATLLQGRVVLIGSTAESLRGDRFYTPYTTDVQNTWSGAELHANVTSQIITSALDGRPILQGVPEPLEWLWISLWAAIGTGLGWSWRSHRGGWRLPVQWTGGALLISCTLFGSAYGLFLLGWWVVVISPLLALTGAGLLSRGCWIWQTLKQANQALELKVQARTQELLEKNSALEQARVDAESANRAKSMFLANMSHELRTPLTAILGFSELLSHSSSLDPEEQEYVTIINRSGEHLLGLINDVLEFSKVEAGAIRLNLKNTNLHALLNNVENMFYLKAISKRLTLYIDCAPDLPIWLQTDEGKLRQVLINLMGNAVKFTDEGSVTLRVRWGRSFLDTSDTAHEPAIEPACLPELVSQSLSNSLEDSNHSPTSLNSSTSSSTLVFEVEDTGPGISSEELDQLFQPFVQTEAGRKLQKGTGLGLSISRQYIHLMGGNIGVRSILGQGSVFSFEIPVCLTSTTHPPLESTLKHSWYLALNQPRKRILVVEDNFDNRRFLVELLSATGFEVRSVENGPEAIAQWEEWQPHVILMDIRMPGMDGYEITQQIRVAQRAKEAAAWQEETPERVAETSAVPNTVIIALTASVYDEDHTAILAAGCNDLIWKPFREATLLTKIAHHLGLLHSPSSVAESETD